MSVGVVRLGDMCSGHGCFPPRKNISGSTKVFVDDLPVHRLGDNWDYHTCETTHAGITIGGSTKAFVENQSIARIGDSIDCGSVCMGGSSRVFSG